MSSATTSESLDKSAEKQTDAVDPVAADADQVKPEVALGQEDDPADAALVEAVDHAASRRTIGEKLEAFISRLSTRNNFWHRACALVWLPFAFKSGIKMKRIDAKTFAAVLPFRRFNRNWYNAMAGAALLGNAEVAGGMYVFGVAGGDYTVVCKHLEYKFMRPCFGPVIYKMTPRQDIEALVATGKEFNITLDLDVRQQSWRKKTGYREIRVGRCTATFHVTPKSQHKAKRQRMKERAKGE